ncbi:hypothetical protein JW905_07665, partial [bacterium]|nr:hypothetical protein [candidate division CSSED10-310 bacterium]
MSLKIDKNKLLLRITLLTPMNCGAMHGDSLLDAPTQKDAYDGLPFIPDSAIKGVIAGQLGDAIISNRKRASLYGFGDHGTTAGQPSKIDFG